MVTRAETGDTLLLIYGKMLLLFCPVFVKYIFKELFICIEVLVFLIILAFSVQSDAISEISSETLDFALIFPCERKKQHMVSFQRKRYKGRISSKVYAWNAVVLDSPIGYRFIIVSQRCFANKRLPNFLLCDDH